MRVFGCAWKIEFSEVIWSWPRKWAFDHGNSLKLKFSLQTISGSKPSKHTVNWNNFWKIYFPCATKHPHLQKNIFGSDLKPKQTQPKFCYVSNIISRELVGSLVFLGGETCTVIISAKNCLLLHSFLFFFSTLSFVWEWMKFLRIGKNFLWQARKRKKLSWQNLSSVRKMNMC